MTKEPIITRNTSAQGPIRVSRVRYKANISSGEATCQEEGGRDGIGARYRSPRWPSPPRQSSPERLAEHLGSGRSGESRHDFLHLPGERSSCQRPLNTATGHTHALTAAISHGFGYRRRALPRQTTRRVRGGRTSDVITPMADPPSFSARAEVGGDCSHNVCHLPLRPP